MTVVFYFYYGSGRARDPMLVICLENDRPSSPLRIAINIRDGRSQTRLSVTVTSARMFLGRNRATDETTNLEIGFTIFLIFYNSVQRSTSIDPQRSNCFYRLLWIRNATATSGKLCSFCTRNGSKIILKREKICNHYFRCYFYEISFPIEIETFRN